MRDAALRAGPVGWEMNLACASKEPAIEPFSVPVRILFWGLGAAVGIWLDLSLILAMHG